MSSRIEELPSQELLAYCAQAWGLSNFVFIRKMENIVYGCDRGAEKVYLRLTTPLRRARPELEAEIHWIEHLEKSGLAVPHLIPDRGGHKIRSFTEGSQHFEAVVFSAVSGEHPSKEKASDPKFLKTLGVLIAKMHQASVRYEPLHQSIKREQWFEERGLRHALEAAMHSKEFGLREQLEETVTWMKRLPRNPKIYGLIHADLGAFNLFIGEDESITIIDFDDSCYHWYVFDLAIVVYSMAGRFEHIKPEPKEKEWLKHLLDGYKAVRVLSETEISWIPRLMHFACLRLFFWIEYHQSLQTFHEEAIDKVTQFKQWAKNRIQHFKEE